MRNQPIARGAARFLLPLIFLFALYVQFHGEETPGGGLQAGVIFAAAFILYAVVFGVEEARRVAPPVVLRAFLAVGVLLHGGSWVACTMGGGACPEYDTLAHPVFYGGNPGIFLMELGAGLTMAAAMMTLFFIFARQER